MAAGGSSVPSGANPRGAAPAKQPGRIVASIPGVGAVSSRGRGGRGGTAGTKPTGRRLSAATRAAVMKAKKANNLTPAQTKALRQSLGSPKAAAAAAKKYGIGGAVVRKQTARDTKRNAMKNGRGK